MMFYNGFNLMIDIILVTFTAVYTAHKVKQDNKEIDTLVLDHEYNQGWEAGYALALRNKNNEKGK